MKHKNNQNNLFTDWKAKIICLVLAVLVYVAFSLGISAERRISLPLDIKLPENLEVTSLIPDTADVVIKGNEEKIYMIDISRISLKADFSDVTATGVASAPVVIDYSDLLDYISVTDVTISTDPAIVKLYFE